MPRRSIRGICSTLTYRLDRSGKLNLKWLKQFVQANDADRSSL